MSKFIYGVNRLYIPYTSDRMVAGNVALLMGSTPKEVCNLVERGKLRNFGKPGFPVMIKGADVIRYIYSRVALGMRYILDPDLQTRLVNGPHLVVANAAIVVINADFLSGLEPEDLFRFWLEWEEPPVIVMGKYSSQGRLKALAKKVGGDVYITDA